MKIQSTMEFLITYGWMILILSVVLSAFMALGVFNPGAIASTQCSLPIGLSCSVYSLAPNGLISVSLLQTTPMQINITAVGCNAKNVAYRMSPYQVPIGANTILFTAQCYSSNAVYSGLVGASFSGYLVINYTETYTGFPHTVSGAILATVT